MNIFEHTLDMDKNMELDCGFFAIVLIVLELAQLLSILTLAENFFNNTNQN